MQTASPLLPNWRRPAESDSDSTPRKLVNDDDEFSPSTDYETDFDGSTIRHKRRQLLDHIRLQASTPWSRLHRHLELFKLSDANFAGVAEGVRDDIARGLHANLHHSGYWVPQISSFRMIDSYISDLPTGREAGVAYAIHIDTQRVRVTRADFHPHNHQATKLQARHWSMFDSGINSRKISATVFFDAIADMLYQVMADSQDLLNWDPSRMPAEKTPKVRSLSELSMSSSGESAMYPVCLCATFPVLQQSINSAILVEWVGSMEAGRDVPNDPIEGTDICAGLTAAFERAKLPARLVAYANDTLGTLCTAAYEYGSNDMPFECLLAVVVSTGLNACYKEPNAKAHYGFQGRLIDLECGNLNRGLPLTPVDYELDFARPQTQGCNLLEKMMAMGYVGEVARRSLIAILQDAVPPQAWQENSLTVQHVINIADDASVGNDRTRSIIEEVWGKMPNLTPPNASSQVAKWDWSVDEPGKGGGNSRHWRPPCTDAELIHRCCWAVVDRCAALTAAVMVGIAKHTGHLRPEMASLLIGQQRRLGFVVGGPFTQTCETYRERLRQWLAAGICENGRSRPPVGIDIIDVDQTDGRGLALIAASQNL